MSLNHSVYHRVNFGPYHPSIKGMLRLVLDLDGETIQKGFCCIGFTHKGIEKNLENKNFIQVQKIIENIDQNFLTPYGFSYAYALNIEKILKITPPLRGQFIRVTLAEMGRIFCHLNQIASIAESVDFNLVSSWSLNLVEEMDALFLEIRNELAVFLVPGGVSKDLPSLFLKKIEVFLRKLGKKIQEIKLILLTNSIFKLRTSQVAVISEVEAISWGLSGPALRASKVAWDLRRAQPYDVYDRLDFKIPVGTCGDSLERTVIRIEEIIQSMEIIKQCLDLLPPGHVYGETGNFIPPSTHLSNQSPEALIHHYKFFTEGRHIPKACTYVAIEGGKGELGLFLSSQETHFDRVRLRTPGFFHMQTIESLMKGHTFSDIPIILASFNICSAEIDR